MAGAFEVTSQGCARCGRGAGPRDRECVVCKSDVGFPNVRYAQRGEERAALEARFSDASSRARAAGLSDAFERLFMVSAGSRAVMNRRLGPLYEWVSGRRPLLFSYHQQVSQGTREPEGNDFDLQRTAAESCINPHFYEQLNVAALSVDGEGMPYYGPYRVLLRENTFSHRATVFTENPFLFAKRHQVIAGGLAPLGHRTQWDSRGKVVMSKLGDAIDASMQAGEFANLLMSRNRSDGDCDFVEVHIYGSVHASCIESVRGPRPSQARELTLWELTKEELARAGASVEET